MAITLRSLIEPEYLQERYTLHYEFRDLDRSHRRQRLAILVQHSLNAVPAYGFEFAVATDTSGYNESCTRAEEFGLLHDCRMTLFTLISIPALEESYFGERGYFLSLVNVFMDPESQTVRYVDKPE